MRTGPLSRSLVLVAALAMVSGCGLLGGRRAPPPQPPVAPPVQGRAPTPEPVAPAPQPVTLTIVGGADMNGGGNAALVRVYPLRGTTTLMGTVVEAFWRDGGDVGADLTGAAQEVLVYPGVETTLTLDLVGETRFLGVAVDLRRPKTDAWRTTFEAAAVRGKTVRVVVRSDAIETTTQ